MKFNVSNLKKIVKLDNDSLFSQAVAKIKNNKTETLTTSEKNEITSFFIKLLQLDDTTKMKVFNLLRQNIKVIK